MEDLQEVCRTIPHVRNLAKHYGISTAEMAAEMKRQGIIRYTRREDVDWADLDAKYQEAGSMPALARMLGTTEKITYGELVRRGIQLRPRGHLKGQKKSGAWRAASAQHWDDPAWREEQRQRWLERLPSMQASRNGGSPLELYLHRALRKAGISFSTQRQLLGRYVVDILITQKPVVIEADGNMHLHAKARERDALRNAAMQEAGYEVYRFPGRPICTDADGCIRQVIEAAGLIRDAEPVYDIRNGLMAEANPRWKGGKPEWTCAKCGKRFRAYLRNGKPPVTCGRDCQGKWQSETGASVANRAPWGTKRQMVVQSGLHEPREDVQS
jgi:very-short-patch-repair endonuclease